MVEHSASVTIKAPLHQVYVLFTHFNDFPKFMSFVQEVTYHDDQRSHWVAQVVRPYEWDAVNVDWITDQQIGWRSIKGLQNSGKVKFRALGPERTEVDVYIQYTPPSGLLGALSEHFGISEHFESILQKDLNHFALMVEQAPHGALDPMSSHYLFHEESAVVKGQATARQKLAMTHDPMMNPLALEKRRQKIAEEQERKKQKEEKEKLSAQHKAEQEEALKREQQAILEQTRAIRRQEERERIAIQRAAEKIPLDPRIAYAAWARGLGDKDGRRARIPGYGRLSMSTRRPSKGSGIRQPDTAAAQPPDNN